MKPAQYKCMSVIVVIVSEASYQMSFKVLLPPTFCFAPVKWACKPVQILSPWVIILYIVITLSVDDVWVLLGENGCWSLTICFCAVLSCQQMTIGKIYCAKLIHENYKYLKRKGMPTERVSTRNNNSKIFLLVVISKARNQRGLAKRKKEEVKEILTSQLQGISRSLIDQSRSHGVFPVSL